jgi:hypothetical protein
MHGVKTRKIKVWRWGSQAYKFLLASVLQFYSVWKSAWSSVGSVGKVNGQPYDVELEQNNILDMYEYLTNSVELNITQQNNPVRTTQSYLSKIHLNIIHPSMSSSSW